MTAAILVVDDDAHVRRFLRAALAGHGYTVAEAGSLADARAELARGLAPKVVLLDLGLPDGDGLDLLAALRPGPPHIPVIILSARGQEGDKVIALDAGADDYLTKPFGAGELMARIRVALRHTEATHAATPEVLTVGPIQIDRARHEVTRDGELVHLTPIEFKILVELARLPGRVITHRQLAHTVWGAASVADAHHTLRVHVAALRRKLEPSPARPRWLVTEAGVGYRLRES